MAVAEQTKVCRFCAETIKAAAKLCPYCRSKQGRYVVWRQELLIGIPAVILIIIAIMLISRLAPEDSGVGGRGFAGHQSDLIVLSTSMDRDKMGKPDFWLAGVVTNQGVYPWRVHEFEVRFLDERGNLLDVRHPDLKDSFVIQSHQAHGFRVELDELAFTNRNITHQVRVQMATDGDRPEKPD
jgi:hypothetical protein